MVHAFWQAGYTFTKEHSATVLILEFHPEDVSITSFRNADTTSQDVNSRDNTNFHGNEVLRYCKYCKHRADEHSIKQFANIVVQQTPRYK